MISEQKGWKMEAKLDDESMLNEFIKILNGEDVVDDLSVPDGILLGKTVKFRFSK